MDASSAPTLESPDRSGPPKVPTAVEGESPRRVPAWVWATFAAFASGGLMSACFWPLNFHFLAWVALVPWLLVLPRLTPGLAGVFGTLLGLVFYAIGFHWIFQLYGHLGALIVTGLAALIGVAFHVARSLMARFGPAAMVWAVPFAYVGQEILRSEALPQYRFAFLVWGYSQSHNLWIAQLASLGGVYFVSFALIVFNAAVAYVLISRQRKRLWVPLAVGVVIVALAALAQPRSYERLPRVGVGCVQGEGCSFAEYRRLTAEALADPAKPVFVVLPEHTIDNTAVGKHTHPLIHSLGTLAAGRGAYICSGTEDDAPAGARCPFENIAVVIGPTGKVIFRQTKAVPVPFFLDGNPAKSQATFPTPYGPVGVYVCYDATFTDIPRRLVDLGAQLLLGPVMDVRHWPAQERWQHADMAPLRSIELRRCVARAASSGVSQIIDAAGRTLSLRTQEQGTGTLCGTVYLTSDRTVFVRGGYLFGTIIGWAFLASIVLLAIDESVRRKRKLT